MILDCPLCHTRYLIAASLFAAGPRRVRCAKCFHNWSAEAPNHIDVVGAPPPEPSAPEDNVISPIPPGSNLPAVIKKPWPKWVFWAMVGVAWFVVIVALLWLVLDRNAIVKDYPFMESAYDSMGLHVFYPGEGLSLVEVRSELKYEDGIMKLIVDGKIANTTEEIQKLPAILVSAMGSDGDIMQSWQIEPPQATVKAKDQTPFQTSINAPKGTVVNVNLKFIEPKDADD